MKVKLLVSRASVEWVQNAGDVVEVSDDEGKRMIEANQAVPARGGKAKKETTDAKDTDVETT